jgi:glycosyltransferase involved in cell wall biosynthesis
MPHIGVGGAERQLRFLIVHSDPAKIHHDVLYYSDARDLDELRHYQQAGISICRVPRNKRRPVRFIRDLAQAIRERRPDVVHCWLVSGGIWGRLAAMRAGCGSILVAYRNTSVFRPGIVRWVERLTRHRVQHLGNSRACAAAVAEVVKVPLERFAVVYNGVAIPDPVSGAERARLRREFDVPEGHQMVVTVGRLSPQKNYPMLLRVAQRARGRLPVRFVVAGHGELETELRSLAAELGVADLVHFAGLRHDVQAIFGSADVFCYTTSFEGFPNVLLEAMAGGLPIVTTGFAGADELIEDGVNGRIVPLDDDAAAFAALQQFCEDGSLAARLGQKARATVTGRFSMEQMVANTLNVYQKMLHEHGCRSGHRGH